MLQMLHIGKVIPHGLIQLQNNLLVKNIKVKMSAIQQAIEKNKLCETYLTAFKNEVGTNCIQKKI